MSLLFSRYTKSNLCDYFAVMYWAVKHNDIDLYIKSKNEMLEFNRDQTPQQ